MEEAAGAWIFWPDGAAGCNTQAKVTDHDTTTNMTMLRNDEFECDVDFIFISCFCMSLFYGKTGANKVVFKDI